MGNFAERIQQVLVQINVRHGRGPGYNQRDFDRLMGIVVDSANHGEAESHNAAIDAVLLEIWDKQFLIEQIRGEIEKLKRGENT